MLRRILSVISLFVLTSVFLSACNSSLFAPATATPTATSTSTPQPTATPTATPVPYFVTATVLSGTIQAPAVLYHRFANDTHDATSTYTRYSDFKAELQKLYDAGYSLVSLSAWLDGTFTVPAGRKPLLFTIDDGWFADQLYINDDGTPSEFSGLGILYQFSQTHPDFGYAAAIFCDMGDKGHYGDQRINNWFYWSGTDADKTKLANVIVWALDHGIEVYSHTYTHADLSLTSPDNIEYELQAEDKALRDSLALVNRTDLIVKLGNIIALPYGNWPSTPDGMRVLKSYINPEGKPVQAIMEAYNANEPQLTPSLFSANFDAMSIPRITSTTGSIDWIVAHKDDIPTAQACRLGPTSEEQTKDPAVLQTLISTAIQAQTCPQRVYQVNGLTFIANGGSVTQFIPQQPTLQPTLSQ